MFTIYLKDNQDFFTIPLNIKNEFSKQCGLMLKHEAEIVKQIRDNCIDICINEKVIGSMTSISNIREFNIHNSENESIKVEVISTR